MLLITNLCHFRRMRGSVISKNAMRAGVKMHCRPVINSGHLASNILGNARARYILWFSWNFRAVLNSFQITMMIIYSMELCITGSLLRGHSTTTWTNFGGTVFPRKGGFYHSDLECPITFVNSKMIKFQILNFLLLLVVVYILYFDKSMQKNCFFLT